MRTCTFFCLGLVIVVLSGNAPDAAERLDDVEKPTADLLVHEALKAELDGEAHLRKSLLQRASELDATHPAARWHSGEVWIDNEWTRVEDAERMANARGVVGAYRQLRGMVGGNLAGEMRLARWCRKNGLEDQERLHWWNVLHLAPLNKEARRRLRVGEFMGRLMTVDQIQNWKEAKQRYDQALETWTDRLNQWQRQMEQSTSPRETEAWKLLSELSDVEAVPALLETFDEAAPELQEQIVLTLANFEQQVATNALVRVAICAESSELRESAAQQLSNRSWFSFVPSLLEMLETPVELRYLVQTLGAQAFVSEISYSQERPTTVVSGSRAVDARFPLLLLSPNNRDIERALGRRQREFNALASRESRAILEARRAVFVKNARSALLNQRACAALQKATGQQIEPRPQSWWQWWQEYNELQAAQQKTEIRHDYTQRIRQTFVASGQSCFLAGTSVWTETGRVPIERIRRGDRVLSQDPASGELGYRTVLDTTIRPASPTLRLHLGETDIVATLGHPLWVVGSGWRMTKELEVGSQLHSVHGGITIDRIEPGPEAEAYNLVVDGTNTYFVGQQRILAHDNMPRRGWTLPVPGWGNGIELATRIPAAAARE